MFSGSLQSVTLDHNCTKSNSRNAENMQYFRQKEQFLHGYGITIPYKVAIINVTYRFFLGS